MRALCLLIALTALPSTLVMAEISGVVVVRHAEKADDDTDDPVLTRAGQARAIALAEALAHADVGELIASQFRRTRQTLSVLSEGRGLGINIVAAESGAIDDHIDALASMVRESDTEGLVVIAGHSNTVPLIVEALTGQVVESIGEREYDRFYLLLPNESGMQVISTRYGAESTRESE